MNVESDSEFTEVGVDEEEAPDYGGDEENIGDGESVKRGEGLDAARKESVESFEEVLMKLSLAIPCHRCGSPDHSVLDCTVGVSVREMVNNLKRVIGEKNYVEDDNQGARGSDGEAPPKRHRRSEGRAPADPGMEYQAEAMSDETAMMERYVMETNTIRLSEIEVDVRRPEMLTDGSGREYAALYDRKFAYKWLLQKLVEDDYEISPGAYQRNSVELKEEVDAFATTNNPRYNRFEGPLVPRFGLTNGLYHLELFKPATGKLLAFALMTNPAAEAGYDLPPARLMSGHTRSPSSATDGDHRSRVESVSRNLSKFLRHTAGSPTADSTGSRRDDGMWVSWLDVLSKDRLWEDGNRYARERDPEQIKHIERIRVHTLCCCILQTMKVQSKSRFHIMAVKVSPRLYQGGDPEVLRFVEYLRSTGVIRHVDQEDLFSYDGMIAFDRIRATSAWSETRGENEGAIIDMSKISIPISQSLSERIPLAFHMTTMKSLKGIADSGIIPGGRRRNRSCTFFSAFPPFGELRSQSTVKWDFSRVINLASSDVMNGLLMLVMRSNVLRGAYDGRVDLDGHFVTNQTIPFSAIDTAWYGLWNEERRSMEWRKILISKEDRRCSGRVVTGVMEGRVRLPRDPRWGDLATRAYEAVKFEDSDLVVGRVDSLVQHFPEFKRKSEFKGEAWKALHGYITVHLPLDYERQLCPECVHWIDARLNICSECYAEFTSSREIHTVSTWQEREDIRRRRAIEKMKAEAKVDEAKEAGVDEQGDANMESAEKDDDEYASKLTEMVNGAMEESDDIEDGSAFSDPSEGQSQPNRVPRDRIDELLFTTEEIERFAKEGVNINYQEVASVLGDEAAQRGFQATGAYYPNMNAAVGGSVAYSRRIESPVPCSWIVGDEVLENLDTDGNIARMLDGHLHRILERTFRFTEHFMFPRTVTPEEHYMKMVKTGRRMDTWGFFHRNIPEEERWRDVEKYFPLREDGTPVPLTEEYFDKRYRYLDYLMYSKFLFPIAKRCIEGMVTIEEIESYHCAT